MTSFKNQNLFASGPCRFVVHGLSQRHAVSERAGGDGGAITGLGRSVRKIEQHGLLAGDTLADLQNQLDAIEAAMDGQVGALVDAHGRTHEQVMMIRFAPGGIQRRGPRLVAGYAIDYLAGA